MTADISDLADSRCDEVLARAVSDIVEVLGLQTLDPPLVIVSREERFGLVNIFSALSGLTGGETDLMRKWLASRCAGMDDRVPLEVLREPEGWRQVLGYLESRKDGGW